MHTKHRTRRHIVQLAVAVHLQSYSKEILREATQQGRCKQADTPHHNVESDLNTHLLPRCLFHAAGAEELVHTEEVQEGDERKEAPEACADKVQDACTRK